MNHYDGPVDVDVAILGGQTFVYVADSNNHRVLRTNGDGNMPSQFRGPAGTGRILGVSAPKHWGFVYATDPVNHRLLRWAWMGPFNGTYGPAGDSHGLSVIDLSFPMGIDQDPDGYVYVVDQGDRVVKKYEPYSDMNIREIAKFGLTIPSVPGPTPDDEFQDPVDIAVTNLKDTYTVDRSGKKVIRYTPTDAQEIWVNVPAGAASGYVEVRTDDGTDSEQFSVYEIASVEIADAYLTQGLVEYPLVAGKKTIIRYQMRTIGATQLHNYHWGSPITDSAVCEIFQGSSSVGQVQGEPLFITGSGGFIGTAIAFEIHFEIPYWLINSPDNYRFEVRIWRTGANAFSDMRSFNGNFVNRQSYNIIASPITHLRHDGTRVSSSSSSVALFYVGADPKHYLDWMDWSQLYSGYQNYNRMYPVRQSMGDISEYGPWVNGAMHNGINNDDEVRNMLLVLELTRRRLNEDTGAGYDYMLGIVDRNEIHQDWNGVTTDDYRSTLISVGDDPSGVPAYDVGSIIAHELLHQHGQHHQSVREFAASDKDAWNSFDDSFVGNPVTLMFVTPAGGTRTSNRSDTNSFAEATQGGINGSYDRLFDAMANPHPKHFHKREFALGGQNRPRPIGSSKNLNLIGSLKKEGMFERTSSWIGSAQTPVTPQEKSSDDCIVFMDVDQKEISRWPIYVSFGLRTMKRNDTESHTSDDTALISLTVPLPETTSHIDLIVSQKTVWSVDIPSKSPSVRLLRPAGGENISSDDTLVVEWEASHPLNAELDYTIEYSSDNGESFRPLGSGLKETHYEWKAGLASKSGQILIKVIATDGFNEASDVSKGINVGDIFTRVVIMQPRPGEVIPEGSPVKLQAMAQNIEDGSLSLSHSNTLWILDEEVIIGEGNDFEFKDIELTTPLGTVDTPPKVGPHRLKVEVTIAPGKKVTDEIAIEIAADSDRDGVPDDVERDRGTSPNDPGDGANIAPIYLFGQWQMRYCVSKTYLQISHLSAGKVLIDLGFINETGDPLKCHPITVIEDGTKLNLTTDNDGWVGIWLTSLQTVLVEIAATKLRYKGFGTCRIRLSGKSEISETIIQAHGWIYRRRKWWIFGRESQGTIVINKGEPLTIRGAIRWSAYSKLAKLAELSQNLLGNAKMATGSLGRLEERKEGE